MMTKYTLSLLTGAALCLPVALNAQAAPENLLPEEQPQIVQPVAEPEYNAPTTGTPLDLPAEATATAQPETTTTAVPETIVTVQPVAPDTQSWSTDQAMALVAVIDGIAAEGLDPADYDAAGLRIAANGDAATLSREASKRFAWLVEDVRDGRTPMSARKQWFVMDPDADRYRTAEVMERALADGDIAGALASIAPEHPDYARLRKELASVDAQSKQGKLIRANMDRWRWLPRDLGSQYLITNVPEYQLRLTVNDNIVRTYRTIVGKPGRTATPQLAESVEGVILNPTWTVPQSIVKGEGLGARVLGNPGWARSKGYTATKGANGWVSVVQGSGPGNALGKMKLDMPNRHAIFFHDTPSRGLFQNSARALSHGCIRTERASELALTLAILQAGLTAEEGVEKLTSGKYTRVAFEKTMPAYITYFTMAQDINGKLSKFPDIYDRDAPVLASLDAPRVADRSRITDEQIIVIENDPRA